MADMIVTAWSHGVHLATTTSRVLLASWVDRALVAAPLRLLVHRVRQVASMVGLVETIRLLLELVHPEECALDQDLAPTTCLLLARVYLEAHQQRSAAL